MSEPSEKKEGAAGTLYLVSTPIGNLSDLSPRAVTVLKSVDLIAAEDTRNTLRLLNHFDIHTKMTAYHEFNRFDKAEELVAFLRDGANIACVTDAGTPGISDPGEVLVRRCREEQIPVVGVPGPAAFVDALVISGLPTKTFCFGGFLPAKKKDRKRYLDSKKDTEETVILYEAPHHLTGTLRDILEVFGDREAALCRELTKIHEEVIRGNLSELIRYYENIEPKGEYVVVIRGKEAKELQKEEAEAYSSISVEEHLKQYTDRGLDRKEAMKAVAADRHVPKKAVYDEIAGKKKKTE